MEISTIAPHLTPENIGLVVLAIALIVGGVFFVKARKKKEYFKTPGEYDVGVPADPARGKAFCHYITDDTQYQETKDHITHHWTAFREGMDALIRDFKEAKKDGIKTVIDLDQFLFHPRKWDGTKAIFREDAVKLLIDFFEMLRANDVLDTVDMVVPTDEPNLPANNAVEALPKAVEAIREAISNFTELDDCKVGCVYFYETAFPNVDMFDVVGVNNYHVRSKILEPGQQYDKLKSMLKPGQKTILFPGSYLGQIPEPFFNFALSPANPEVWMISNFLWSDRIDGSNFKALRVRGGPEEDNLKERYIAGGKQIKSLQ